MKIDGLLKEGRTLLETARSSPTAARCYIEVMRRNEKDPSLTEEQRFQCGDMATNVELALNKFDLGIPGSSVTRL